MCRRGGVSSVSRQTDRSDIVLAPRRRPLCSVSWRGAGRLAFKGITGLPECVQVGGEVAGRDHGVGVVVAEHTAAAGQGVLIQLAGRLVLAESTQGGGEAGCRDQGAGVVVAEGPAAAGQGVLIEMSG